MHNVIPFEKLIEPDPIHSMFVGPITTDSIQQLFENWDIQDTVPDDAKKQFQVARKLFVYGYFVYEFDTVAGFVSVLAVESALIHCFNDYYNKGSELAKKNGKTIATRYEEAYRLLRKGWVFSDDPEFRGGFKSLILWAGRKRLLSNSQIYSQALPRIRASHAHPLFQTVLSIGMAHGMMVKAIQLVNELFTNRSNTNP